MAEPTMRQMRPALASMLCGAGLVGAAFGVIGSRFDDRPTILNASILAVYCVLLVVLSFSRDLARVTWVVSGATLLFAAVMTIAQPFLSVNLLLSPVLVAALALPYLDRPGLLKLFVICGADANLILWLGDLPYQSKLPPGSVHVLARGAAGATIIVLLFLLYLAWSWKDRLYWQLKASYRRLQEQRETIDSQDAQVLAQLDEQLRQRGGG